ncbi:MAG: hypothetical protein F4X14_16660 [Caldilineaceae bacterium SB0661_bin_32]|uniref:Uncharacterized protein n=1 Tax=Caldilineaceae bacterium SB0661_bin_32 TaxID=2605255 RepID=A0A6B1DA47_9CHLR|nr:hypothetical protein [Caldilineaceae bacterium SB0661_bin_32]
MPTSFTPSDVASILAYLIPGFIAISVRSQFVTTPHLQNSERLLSYLTISVIYDAIVIRFFPGAIAGSWFGIGFILVFIVGPIIVGVILGVNTQKDFVRGLLAKARLTTIHPIPTAWDWKFTNITGEQWVLVNLKNGDEIRGLLGSDSFASSNPIDRDLYIQWIYGTNEEGLWIPLGDRGVLIATDEIRTIEFWPYVPPGDNS